MVTDVDSYLEAIPSDAARDSLKALRAAIRAAAPEAEECIAYGIPTYKFHGMLCSFGAFKKHCSFFPGHTVRDFTEELKGYAISKGTVQFSHDRPLPEGLVTAMVKARMAENLGKRAVT